MTLLEWAVFKGSALQLVRKDVLLLTFNSPSINLNQHSYLYGIDFMLLFIDTNIKLIFVNVKIINKRKKKYIETKKTPVFDQTNGPLRQELLLVFCIISGSL